MLRRNAVENEMQCPRIRFHLLRIGTQNHLIGTQPLGVFGFGGRCGDDHHVSAHGFGEFNAHMSQTTNTYNAHFLARSHLPVFQRRISSDARAQKWRSSSQVKISRHTQYIIFIHHHTLRVSTKGVGVQVFIWRVISTGHSIFAVVLQSLLTAFANATAIYQATYCCKVANFILGNGTTYFRDLTNDLVTRHAGIHGSRPFVTGGVDV